MANTFITSADATFLITIAGLFNAPVTLQEWEADRAWETSSQEIAEARMSVDGRLLVGYVPTTIEQTLTFAPSSPSIEMFDELYSAAQQAKTSFFINGELTLPGLGKKYTFTRGIVRNYIPVPTGARTLEGQTVNFVWEAMIPAGI